MIVFDNLSFSGSWVFDDLGESGVSTITQFGDVSIIWSSAAAQSYEGFYSQNIDVELFFIPDAVQTHIPPGTEVIYGQVGTFQLALSAAAVQAYIAAPVLGPTYTQNGDLTVLLSAAAFQLWLASDAPEPEPVVYTQDGDLQLVFAAVGSSTYIPGSVFKTTVAELLQQLYIDELSDMFIGNRTSIEETRPKLLPLLNSAMKYAYAKWDCAFQSTILNVTDNQHDYQLKAGNVLQITQLMNVYGIPLMSCDYLISGQTIHFPTPTTQDVEVIYKISHADYRLDQDDTAVFVMLPEMLHPWLRAYVSYRYFASMKTPEALSKAADCFAQTAMYENLFVQTNTTNEFTAPVNDKMGARGFA